MNLNKLILLTLLIIPLNLSSQIISDTLNAEIARSGEFKSSKFSSFTNSFTAPSFLLVSSFIAMPFSQDFNTLRNEYAPTFDYSYDDYLQYLPAVALLGMKIGGVESRSSWGKMLVADAFSIVLMAGLVNGIKYTAKVQRPDGSARNSFPSGHTATAFLTATMFHKEYGHLSPWYSVGAYTVSTTVALTRLLNNKHWMSDVLAGASIGIFSVELGYMLSDLIFKKEKNAVFNQIDPYYSKAHSPSFISLYSGVNNFMGRGADKLNMTTSANIGIEGAWFMNPYLGVGGQTTASTIPNTLDGQPQQQHLSLLSGAVGGYFSYPLSTRFRAGSKALFSMDHADKSMHYGVMTGLSISYQSQHHLGLRIFTDYKYLPTFINNYASHIITVGAAIEIML